MRLGRAAALKLLTPALGEADFRERFLRESRLAASLDHPSIVPVYDAGEADDLLYIAMAHSTGSDLKTLLVGEGRLPLRRALRIVSQIASALDAAHARGLVHRDVKPANILVGADDRAFLSDFGVVKELRRPDARAPAASSARSTTARPSRSRADVDARADVYALACVLYECIVGTSPFRRSSDVAMLNAHLHAPPPRSRRRRPTCRRRSSPCSRRRSRSRRSTATRRCGEFVAALAHGGGGAAGALARGSPSRSRCSPAPPLGGRRESRPRSCSGLRQRSGTARHDCRRETACRRSRRSRSTRFC